MFLLLANVFKTTHVSHVVFGNQDFFAKAIKVAHLHEGQYIRYRVHFLTLKWQPIVKDKIAAMF